MDRRYSKRIFCQSDGGKVPYNLRKKRKSSVILSGDCDRPNTSQMRATEEEVKAATSSNSTWRASVRSSLEFPKHSQDELRRIYSQGKGKDFYTQFDFEDSDSSEEEEGTNLEELKKSDVQKLFEKNTDARHDELRRIYSQGKGKDFYTQFDFEDSDSSEEEEGTNLEELKKSDVQKLFEKNTDARHV